MEMNLIIQLTPQQFRGFKVQYIRCMHKHSVMAHMSVYCRCISEQHFTYIQRLHKYGDI